MLTLRLLLEMGSQFFHLFCIDQHGHLFEVISTCGAPPPASGFLAPAIQGPKWGHWSLVTQLNPTSDQSRVLPLCLWSPNFWSSNFWAQDWKFQKPDLRKSLVTSQTCEGHGRCIAKAAYGAPLGTRCGWRRCVPRHWCPKWGQRLHITWRPPISRWRFLVLQAHGTKKMLKNWGCRVQCNFGEMSVKRAKLYQDTLQDFQLGTLWMFYTRVSDPTISEGPQHLCSEAYIHTCHMFIIPSHLKYCKHIVHNSVCFWSPIYFNFNSNKVDNYKHETRCYFDFHGCGVQKGSARKVLDHDDLLSSRA